jgi:hypothetical protein
MSGLLGFVSVEDGAVMGTLLAKALRLPVASDEYDEDL